MPLEMFDNIRILSTPFTEQLGLAGLIGQIYGDTTPSMTGVNVIGDSAEDRAFNVVIPGKSSDLWLAAEILEFVDHAPGTKVRMGDKRWVRSATGEWIES